MNHHARPAKNWFRHTIGLDVSVGMEVLPKALVMVFRSNSDPCTVENRPLSRARAIHKVLVLKYKPNAAHVQVVKRG
jgi:hypothetical protein